MMKSISPSIGIVAFALLLGSAPAIAVPKASSYDKLPPAKKGGTLYLTLSGNPKVLNPLLSSDSNSRIPEPYLWATLLAEDEDTLQPLPYLAESYSVSSDRKHYTFVLNKDATWEDGSTVTTDDVKFTFDSMMDPKVDAAPMRAYWEGVELQVINLRTFKLSVKEPKFDTFRSLFLFPVVQKKQYEGEPDFNKAKAILNPKGNGPYRIKSFSRDQKMEIERRKDWWGYKLKHFRERFNFDQIVFRMITDPSLEYERFLKGDLDVINFVGPGIETFVTKVRGVDKDKFGTKREDGKSLWATEIENKAPRGFSYVGWNLRLPMFKSVKTRTALAYLADYQQIIDKVFHGFYYQSTSPFGSRTLNSASDLRKPGKMITFDRKKALALLREDGWTDTNGDNILDKVIDGKRVDFRFTLKFNSNNPARAKIAQILKENFKMGGIEIDIRSMEWNAFLSDVDQRNFDAVILAWGATPFANPKQVWHTDSEKNQGSNFVAYSNPKVDALIEKANREFDMKGRAKLMQEINRLVYADQPYMFMLEARSLVMGLNSKLRSAVWAMSYSVEPPVDLYWME